MEQKKNLKKELVNKMARIPDFNYKIFFEGKESENDFKEYEEIAEYDISEKKSDYFEHLSKFIKYSKNSSNKKSNDMENPEILKIKDLVKKGEIPMAVKEITRKNLFNLVRKDWGIKQWEYLEFFNIYCALNKCDLEDIYDSKTKMFKIKDNLKDPKVRKNLLLKFENFEEYYLKYLKNNGLISENHYEVIKGILENDRNSDDRNKDLSKRIINTILMMPTQVKNIKNKNIVKRIMEQLNKKIYGYEDIKEMIIEDLVAKGILKEGKRVCILLYGEPGLGKSMFAKAVAEALELPLHLINLSQADSLVLKGSYRTWNQATYGRIAEALINNKGYKTCIFLLDEIDKAGESKNHGRVIDIVSAILDPEIPFIDDYLGIELDLSHCIFFITANDISDIPKYLLDRVSLYQINQPSEEAKKEIMKLMVKRKNDSLKSLKIKINAEDIINKVDINNISFRAFESILDRVVKRLILKKVVDKINESTVDKNFLEKEKSLFPEKTNKKCIPLGFISQLK